MKALYLLILVSAQALAWPWTTVDDCTAKYVPKAESNQGAKIVRTACINKYQTKIDNDGLFDCIVDKVVTAKTDAAASMMAQLCWRENPSKAQFSPRINTEQQKSACMEKLQKKWQDHMPSHDEQLFEALECAFPRPVDSQ